MLGRSGRFCNPEDVIKTVSCMLDKNPKLPLASLTNYVVSLVGDQDIQIYEDIFRELASNLGMDYKEYISAYSLGGVVESFFGFFSDYKERVRKLECNDSQLARSKQIHLTVLQTNIFAIWILPRMLFK